MPKVKKPAWRTRNERWLSQGEKFAPVKTLPDGKIFAPWQKRRDVTPESIIGRVGVVAIGNYDAPFRIQHGFHHANDIYRNHIAASGVPPGRSDLWTREQVRAAASAYPLYPCEGNDFGEGTNSFAPQSNQAFWWFERRKEMYADPAINTLGLVRRDYGFHGLMALQGSEGPWYSINGPHISPTDPSFRNAYRSVADARAGIGFFRERLDNMLYESLVGCNVKSYAELPDFARMYFQKRYCMERMGKGMGKVGGLGPGFLVFNDWSKLEGTSNGNPGTVGNGLEYERRIETPGASGTVYTGEHPQVDYDWQVGCALINGFMYSNGYTTFDVPTRFGVDPSKMAALNTTGPNNDNAISVRWRADNGSTPAPVTADGHPVEPNGWHDAGFEAADFFSTFTRTAGVPWAPMTYRFAGSQTWITPPADGASILEHAAAFDGPNSLAQGARRGRPTVDGRVKGSALDFVAFDASRGKMYREEIRILAPNGVDQIPVIVQGCVPQVYNETI